MKTLIAAIYLLFFVSHADASTTFLRLSEINKYWSLQTDIVPDGLRSVDAKTDRDWIKVHLELVEQTLRKRPTNMLSNNQRRNRLYALNLLNQYWHAGNFPINKDYSFRTPIFIDQQDNFCAVGYLIKRTGFEPFARKVAADNNLGKVVEMNYPELDAWATTYGFTKEELAWIQPLYGPADGAQKIGRGVDSAVLKLAVVNDTMYVGGIFSTIDSIVPANNIAFVTESSGNYVWHTMGTGVNGLVQAITEYRGRIYIGGKFSKAGDTTLHHVAYWESGSWHASGCLNGEIKDLIVYQDKLYACGNFGICAGAANVNLAMLNDTVWQEIPGLQGRINTLKVIDSLMYIGGLFTYNAAATNAIKWNGNSFGTFARTTANEVNAFEHFRDTIFVGTDRPIGIDSNSFYWIVDNSIDTLPYTYGHQLLTSGRAAIKAMASSAINIDLGGLINGGLIQNQISYMPIDIFGSYFYWGHDMLVNDEITTMVYFKNKLVAGGRFKMGYADYWLHGICYKLTRFLNTPELRKQPALSCYPNPAVSNSHFFVENNFQASRYLLLDITGRVTQSGMLEKHQQKQSLLLQDLCNGVYFLKLSNENNDRAVQRLVIK